MFYKFRPNTSGPDHVKVQVFVGPRPQELALSGQLCFRREEWFQFREKLVDLTDIEVESLR